MLKWARWRDGLIIFLVFVPVGLGMTSIRYHHVTPDRMMSVLLFATGSAMARIFLAPVIQQKFGSPHDSEDDR